MDDMVCMSFCDPLLVSQRPNLFLPYVIVVVRTLFCFVFGLKKSSCTSRARYLFGMSDLHGDLIDCSAGGGTVVTGCSRAVARVMAPALLGSRDEGDGDDGKSRDILCICSFFSAPAVSLDCDRNSCSRRFHSQFSVRCGVYDLAK